MWIPRPVIDLFGVSADLVKALQSDLAVSRAECDLLKQQLLVTQNNFEWIRTKVNQLELERAQLLAKSYGVAVPAPQIERRVQVDPALDPRNFSFDDIGDEAAKRVGLPTYDTKN